MAPKLYKVRRLCRCQTCLQTCFQTSGHRIGVEKAYYNQSFLYYLTVKTFWRLKHHIPVTGTQTNTKFTGLAYIDIVITIMDWCVNEPLKLIDLTLTKRYTKLDLEPPIAHIYQRLKFWNVWLNQIILSFYFSFSTLPV